jgi:predicted nucleic acid-binding protein
MIRRFYWENSAFVAWLNREAGRFEVCDAILRSAEKGELRIVTSAITLVELFGYSLADFHGKSIDGETVRQIEDKIKDLFKTEFIEIVSVDRFIAQKAHDIRRDTPQLRKKSIDAIHLSSAIFTGVDEMHSYDADDLLRLSPFSGLKIVQPHWDFQIEMSVPEK